MIPLIEGRVQGTPQHLTLVARSLEAKNILCFDVYEDENIKQIRKLVWTLK